MGQLWCNNCLEAIEKYPCSHCGYTPADENQVRYALTGHVLAGRYLVGRILGQGGFGITYLGMDLKLDKKVAIKEFYPSGHVSRYVTMGTRLDWNHTPAAQTMRSSGVETFLREARKISKVSHIQNVVGVQDVIQENDTAYIIMNYVQGTTLKDVLAKEGPMDWDRAREIFLPVIRTMAQVHKAGLVHRDISPDNLMLQPDGQVQILDLGAAKDISVDGGLTSALVAKAGFSPLEQYGVTGKSGTWTDVYAMGATIYYTVTGVLPPLATDRLDRDNLLWDLPRLQALPKPVVSALKDAMALRISDRIQTMDAFLAAMDDVPENTSASENKEASASNAKETIVANQSISSKSAKKPKKQSKRIAVIALLIVIAAYCGSYITALNLVKEGEGSKAKKWLLLPVITQLHDQALVHYVNATDQFEQMHYGDAMSGFAELGEYLDASVREKESRYRYAIQLSDNNDHDKAIDIMKKLKREGYGDADEQLTLIKYHKSQYLLQNNKYLSACSLLSELADAGYRPAAESLKSAQANIYKYACTEYANGDYNEAEALFQYTDSYSDTDKYLTLLKAIKIDNRDDGAEIWKELEPLFDFANTKDIILTNESIFYAFIRGRWKAEGYYYIFEVDGNYSITYSLPWIEHEDCDYYRIEDGVYLLYPEEDFNDARPLFSVTIITPDCIEMYCHKNDTSYTMKRK